MQRGRKLTLVGRASRHHGWANPGNWEEPTLGLIRTYGAQLATHRRSPQGEGRDAEKKRKEVEASVPARTESSGLVARTSIETLQKSVGDVWPRISSANALQKERTGSSERGSSSERRSAGETVGRRVERNARRESTSPVKTGEDRRKAQGGARVPSSGRNIVKSGEAVAGPGL
jgi:hypothetical protein